MDELTHLRRVTGLIIGLAFISAEIRIPHALLAGAFAGRLAFATQLGAIRARFRAPDYRYDFTRSVL